MRKHRVGVAAVAIAAGGLLTTSMVVPAGAGTKIKTQGTAKSLSVSWTEYDPDNKLGLPGNVHVGWLFAGDGPYGMHVGGNVTDFDCDPGEVPWGGHHVVVDTIGDVAADATEDTIEAAIDSGATSVDPEEVTAAVDEQLAIEIPADIVDAVEEVKGCDYIQDRFLSGDSNIKLVVDMKRTRASLTGNLVVTGGHGGHGEDPGPVLGRPPVTLEIAGGEWHEWEYSYSGRGKTYTYSHSEKGKWYAGGVVSGSIGAMGFDDDPDDESYGDFSQYQFKTVEKFR